MDLNLSPSPYPLHQIYEIDHDHQLQLIPFVNSSSPPFLGSSAQDHGTYRYHDQGLSRQDYHCDRLDAYGSIMNKDGCSDFKLTLRNKFEDQVQETMSENTNAATTPEKWATSDARMIHKIKNATTPVRVSIKIMRSGDKKIDEDQKLQQQPSSSNSSDIEPSNESPPHNNHMTMSPVRVCTDCYTTKTPLWRSGPKGPKSLCNACGIRQRKARRAMAAAAAASGTAIAAITKQPRKTMKMHCKENKAVKNINYRNASSSSPSPFKKRFKTRVADCTGTSNVGSSSSGDNQKKIGIEDFLMSWSNNLGLHRVFPEEEKDAAILLMAMSSGLVHG